MELFDILTYDYAIVENVDVSEIEPDWQDLCSLVTPMRSPGTYKLTFSLQFHINSTSQEFLYRFSLDGGGNWGPTYAKKVKGRDNMEMIEVLDIIELTASDTVNLKCQVSKTSSVDCTITKALISCERKK